MLKKSTQFCVARAFLNQVLLTIRFAAARGIRASRGLPNDPDLIVAKLPVGRYQSQLFNYGLSDEQSVEGILVMVGQRIGSQSMVQMYGQNLKAIGSHLLGDEVLKAVTSNAKTAEASLDRDLQPLTALKYASFELSPRIRRAREESCGSSVTRERRGYQGVPSSKAF